MNIPILLTPKCDVQYIYAEDTLQNAMNCLRSTGYTAIPVITAQGMYAGSLSEGDILWYLADNGMCGEKLRDTPLRKALNDTRNPPAVITAPMEEVFLKSMQQNFIPVVDDRGAFVGIVTRKSIIDKMYQSMK